MSMRSSHRIISSNHLIDICHLAGLRGADVDEMSMRFDEMPLMKVPARISSTAHPDAP